MSDLHSNENGCHWKSRHQKVFVATLVIGIPALMYIVYLFEGRSVYMYIISVFIVLTFFRLFYRASIYEVKKNSAGLVEIRYYNRFAKEKLILSRESPAYFILEHKLVSHINRAWQLSIYELESDRLICCAKEISLSWREKDLKEIASVLDEVVPASKK